MRARRTQPRPHVPDGAAVRARRQESAGSDQRLGQGRAFLKALNDCVPYYPGGTSAVMKELGEGTRDMTVTVTGWDLNPRALGIVPAEFKVQAFDNMTWVNDAHYMVIPKGVPKESSTCCSS